MDTLFLILLPLAGTTLGAAAVYAKQHLYCARHTTALNGFAAGVMTAASVWSLLLPALERSQNLPIPAFLPAVVGLWLGFLFLIQLERIAPAEGNSMLCFAVALHNLPEGMAVGAAIAAWHSGGLSYTAVLALSLGIAIQNLPEGAIISMPLAARGMSRRKALGAGGLSGIVEPVGAAVTMMLAELVLPVLPYLLSFSAGAMLYVVVRELVPESCVLHRGTLWFAAGFSLMMVLDVALG